MLPASTGFDGPLQYSAISAINVLKDEPSSWIQRCIPISENPLHLVAEMAEHQPGVDYVGRTDQRCQVSGQQVDFVNN
jgi:hypothetical protein